MIHGYSPVYWALQPTFAPDPNVVSRLEEAADEDGNTLYVVEIHDGLLYSDGSPITAYDYAFSFMLGAAPQIKAIGGAANASSHVMGYDEFHRGESPVFAGVRVYDRLTFGVEVSAQNLPFFYELEYLDVCPYPIAVIAPGCEVADDGYGAYIRNVDTGISSPLFTEELLKRTVLDPDTGYLSHPSVSSGPYRLTSYDPIRGEARFAINAYYAGNWNGMIATIDNIVMKPVTPETMMQELDEGSVQLLNKVVAAKNILEGIDRVANNRQTAMQSYPRLGLGFMHFSCDRGVFVSQSVRQAAAYLVDTKEVASRFNQNFGMPVYGYYGMGQWMIQLLQSYQTWLDIDDPQVIAEWEGLAEALASLNRYEIDLDHAIQLLVDDGWTLNENGEDFTQGADGCRYKRVDGELMPLVVRWGKLQDSYAAEILHQMIAQPFADAGFRLEAELVTYPELMEYFFRARDYRYDMLYLATNFMRTFDPSLMFSTKEEAVGTTNLTGLRDNELEALALELRRTAPGDLLEYVKRWIMFQQAFNEKLPLLPVYSNIYYDFFTPALENYYPNAEMSFPVALLSASYAP